MAETKKSWVEWAGQIFQALLWAATFVVGLAWLSAWPLPFDAEPVTVLLGLTSAAVSALVQSYANLIASRRAELESEKFSMPDALAHGYVNNFLEPAITRLLEQAKPGAVAPHLYVYMPQEMSELEPQAIERTLARIKQRNFSTASVNLDFKDGRARDVLTILSSENQRAWYFDFPNTLRTLAALVDFKVPSAADSFNVEARRKQGRVYIDRFEARVRSLLQEKGLADYVHFADRDLAFLDQGPG